ITGNSLIEEPCELVVLGPSPERRETVAFRVTRKRRVLVKPAHKLNPRVTSDPQIENSSRRLILRTAARAQPLRGERAGTCRTDQMLQEVIHRLEDCVNERSQRFHSCRDDQE